MKDILIDVDGVIIQSNIFSKQYVKLKNIKHDAMLPFFQGVFQECIIGKADLKEVVQPFLKQWKWTDSVDEFLNLWFSLQSELNLKVIKKIAELKQAGINCHIATNQEKYRIEYFRKELQFEKLFETIFSSCEIGCKKNDPKYFEYVIKKLKCKPEEITFFDNSSENILCAKKLGINAVFYNFKQLSSI